jgi:hypothetical protein
VLRRCRRPPGRGLLRELALGRALPGRRRIVYREVLHHVMKSAVGVLVKVVCPAQPMEEFAVVRCANFSHLVSKVLEPSPLSLGTDMSFDLRRGQARRHQLDRLRGRRIANELRRKKLDAIAAG